MADFSKTELIDMLPPLRGGGPKPTAPGREGDVPLPKFGGVVQEARNIGPETIPIGVKPGRTTATNVIESLEAPLITLGSILGFGIGGGTGLLASAPTVGATAPLTGPVGAALGSGLGAAGGKSIHNIIEQIATDIFNVPGLTPPKTASEATEGLVNEALLDVAFTAGVPGAAAIIRGGKQAVGRAFSKGVGVTDEALQKAADISKRLGVDLNLLALSDSTRSQFFTKVLSRMPLIGGGVRKQSKMAAAQLADAKGKFLLQYGPVMNMAELGMDMNKAVDARFGAFNKMFSRKYEAIAVQAKAVGATVKLSGDGNFADDLFKTMDDLVERRGPGAVQDNFILRKLMGLTEGKALKITKNKDIFRLSKKGNIIVSDDIPLARWEGLMDQVNELGRQAKAQGFDANLVGLLRRSLENSLNTLSDPAILKQLRNTDTQFSRVMREVFETPTAKKAELVTRGRFKKAALSRAGTRNPDQTMKLLFDENSADGIKGLHRLVGPRRFKAAVSTHLNSVFDTAIAENVSGGTINPEVVNTLKKSLGLVDKRGLRFAATKEMIERAGGSMQNAELLVDALEGVIRQSPDDVAAFLARRVGISGGRGLVRSLLPSATLAGGSTIIGGPVLGAASIAGVLMTRKFATIVANPRWVKLATTAATSPSPQAANAAIKTLLNLMLTEEEKAETVQETERTAKSFINAATKQFP